MKKLLIAASVFVILCFIYAVPIMLIWNNVVPEVVGLKRIDYIQALQITALVKLLIDGVGSGGNGRDS